MLLQGERGVNYIKYDMDDYLSDRWYSPDVSYGAMKL